MAVAGQVYFGTEVAQSGQCLTNDCTTGVRSPAEAKNIFSSLRVQITSKAHPVFRLMGSGGKARLGRDADHSPPSTMSRSYFWEVG
jgi:hypothetical protein